jgi:hypothetical protein
MVLNDFAKKKSKCQPKIVAQVFAGSFMKPDDSLKFLKTPEPAGSFNLNFPQTPEPDGSLILKFCSSAQTQRVLRKPNTHPHPRPQAQPSSFKPHAYLLIEDLN